eukprot:16291313-Heterocapsa_arctica.AAC.1
MRYAQHTTIREMEARFEARLLEERREAEHAASLARLTALAELKKSEATGEQANQDWSTTLKKVRDGHEALQAKVVWDHNQ